MMCFTGNTDDVIPEAFLDKKVSKKFRGRWFKGTVTDIGIDGTKLT